MVRLVVWVAALVALAIPKSAIFVRPWAVTMRFSGLRSRWTTARSAAWASPASTSSSTPPTCSSDRRPTYGRSDAALEVLHRDVGRAAALEVVVDRDDVRVAERAGEPGLAQEAAGDGGLGALQERELLERDVAVELALAGEVDGRHAAAADLAEDLVSADTPYRRHAPNRPVPRRTRRTAAPIRRAVIAIGALIRRRARS